MLLLISFAAVAIILPILWIVNARIPPPARLGANDGLLAACPESPNCVSSQSKNQRSRVDPLPFSGTPETAHARIRDVIMDLPRSRLVRQTTNYLHFEFRSLVCRFVDDVEFLIDPDAGVIHARSASRVGYSDLGANQRRLDTIRQRWAALEKRSP
ncbi:MAG: DUF1499 domain-containing protein [Limisphaerales bacterium]